VITRAKQRLWITYANTRYRFGQLVQNDPSRFIEEIPEQYLDRSFAGGGSRNNSGSKWGSNSSFDRMKGWGGSSYNDVQDAEKRYGPAPSKKQSSTPSYLAPKTTQPKVVEHTPSVDFVASDTSNLQAGQKVEHQKFGFGEVVKLEGAAHNPIATVKFEHNGEKKIMLNYAKLRIIE
jgi:DNA helicase II / ATP-dependent DNA helicase PcrA